MGPYVIRRKKTVTNETIAISGGNIYLYKVLISDIMYSYKMYRKWVILVWSFPAFWIQNKISHHLLYSSRFLEIPGLKSK